MTCSGTPSAQACYSTQVLEDRGARGGPEMQIVGALDVHRRQITTKTLDLESGEVRRGRISPAAREPLREWLERFAGREAHFALEGTTGFAVRGRGDRAGRSRRPPRRPGRDRCQAGAQAPRQ